SARQAQLTFAMARHALVDLSQILSAKPLVRPEDRLPRERYAQIYDKLCGMGVRVCGDQQSGARLNELRGLYEGYAEALSRYLEMPLPPFFIEHPKKDNWLTVARVRAEAEAGSQASASVLLHDEEHLF